MKPRAKAEECEKIAMSIETSGRHRDWEGGTMPDATGVVKASRAAQVRATTARLDEATLTAISKTHPDACTETCARWIRPAPPLVYGPHAGRNPQAFAQTRWKEISCFL